MLLVAAEFYCDTVELLWLCTLQGFEVLSQHSQHCVAAATLPGRRHSSGLPVWPALSAV